jgi:hypothetical protein
MYQLPTNRPFMVEEDGTNSPLDHQRVISKLTMELGILFYHQKRISLEPLPETPLAEGPGHAVPDVILFDNETQETRIIIEVSQSRGFKNDASKIVQLIDNHDYGIVEGFVYNYRTEDWLRYRKGDGGLTTASSFSEVLGVELRGFV